MVEEGSLYGGSCIKKLVIFIFLLPCLIRTISSTIQASTLISTTATQTKIMVLESQKEEYKNAKKTYD